MPRGESFWNPYRLIPLKEGVNRTSPQTHERISGKSGEIHCTLKNLTPLFIGAQATGSFHRPLLRDNKRIIPGSTLKGMLRSVAEIVGGGCFVVQNKESPHDPIYNACSDARRLCIACRMFGMIARVSGARVHRGKLGFGDALIREDAPGLISLEVLLTNNKLRHVPFYLNPNNGRLDGNNRKLYFHQPARTESALNIPSSIQKHAWKIEAVRADHHFDFKLQFTNLTSEELDLLFYVLALEEEVNIAIEDGTDHLNLKGPMLHKIGNGKPSGLGSCRIDIERVDYLAEPSKRFASLSGQSTIVTMEGDSLRKEIQDRIRPFAADTSAAMQGLRKMMVWDENDPRDFRYPEYHWFKNPANVSTLLKSM